MYIGILISIDSSSSDYRYSFLHLIDLAGSDMDLKKMQVIRSILIIVGRNGSLACIAMIGKNNEA